VRPEDEDLIVMIVFQLMAVVPNANPKQPSPRDLANARLAKRHGSTFSFTVPTKVDRQARPW
jgi:hypothetical protein